MGGNEDAQFAVREKPHSGACAIQQVALSGRGKMNSRRRLWLFAPATNSIATGNRGL
jgi:hypothetical protein